MNFNSDNVDSDVRTTLYMAEKDCEMARSCARETRNVLVVALAIEGQCTNNCVYTANLSGWGV